MTKVGGLGYVSRSGVRWVGWGIHMGMGMVLVWVYMYGCGIHIDVGMGMGIGMGVVLGMGMGVSRLAPAVVEEGAVVGPKLR